MTSFGVNPDPTPETETEETTPVEETPEVVEEESTTPKTQTIEVEIDEDKGPFKTTDQANHLYSYEIDERKKADVTGVYYDDLKRMEAEQHRAKLEKREPDFDTMGGIASTPLLRMTERPSEPTS